jgi:hypothetical protein
MSDARPRAGFPNFSNFARSGHGDSFTATRRYGWQSMAWTMKKSPAGFAVPARVGKRIFRRPARRNPAGRTASSSGGRAVRSRAVFASGFRPERMQQDAGSV